MRKRILSLILALCAVVCCGAPLTASAQAATAPAYHPPVSGVPGTRTLKNFLATAMKPVGTALYIYGGGWNRENTGAGQQTTSIGLSKTWLDFFHLQNETYSYKGKSASAQSYYPHSGYNDFYYAGLDCSGYVGWSVYNVMNVQNGGSGYVMSSTNMAKAFAESYHFGSFTQTVKSAKDFRAGDIFSMKGHVWICMGVCADGSIVIAHSSPTKSKAGQPGGGVQLSGMGKSADCQAYRLAKHYMETYYPAWSARYPTTFQPWQKYTAITEAGGKFSWNLSGGGLYDQDGYASKTADEILADLFQGAARPQ